MSRAIAIILIGAAIYVGLGWYREGGKDLISSYSQPIGTGEDNHATSARSFEAAPVFDADINIGGGTSHRRATLPQQVRTRVQGHIDRGTRRANGAD